MSDPTRRVVVIAKEPVPPTSPDVILCHEAMEGLRAATRRLADLAAAPPSPTRERAVKQAKVHIRRSLVRVGLALWGARANASGSPLVPWEDGFLSIVETVVAPFRPFRLAPGPDDADFVGPSPMDCEIALSFGPTGSAPPPAPRGDDAPDDRPPILAHPHEAPPKPAKKRGRPRDTDADEDRRIAEAWGSGRYATYSELAAALRKPARVVELAIGRHRKRESRRAGQNRRTDSRQGR